MKTKALHPSGQTPLIGAGDNRQGGRERGERMKNRRAGRVIVGIDDSLAGLRALREAANQARHRNAELVAMRVYDTPSPPRGSGRWTTTASGVTLATRNEPSREAIQLSWQLCEQKAQATIKDTFGEAMGSVPSDITVSPTTIDGSVREALVRAASCEDDLLVVGSPLWSRWRPWNRSIGRFCAARAACPVLLVPPPRAARDLKRLRWRRRRFMHEIDELSSSQLVS